MDKNTEILFLEKVKKRIEYMDKSDESFQLISGLLGLIEEKNKTLNDLKEEMKELDESSKRDALTGLYNRKAEQSYFKEEFKTLNDPTKEEADTYYIIAIDLDHFKSINDTYGHDVGDDALIIVARGLESAFRRYDLVVREGGDEFVIIAKNCPPSILEDRLKNMSTSITNTIHNALDSHRRIVDGEEVSIERPHDYTISYGYSELDLSGLNNDLLEDRDAFMEWFKEQKKAADSASFNMKEEHHAVRR